MNEEILKKIWQQCKRLEGKIIHTDNASENMSFVKESREAAKRYEWLYHCTNAGAFLSILKNREFWLSNLQLVNDKEEVGRVDIPEYQNTYYVACFTYDTDIPNEHWIEYGNMHDGVLVGIKKEWFKREAFFLDGGNEKTEDDFFDICINYDEALSKKIEQQMEYKKIINPFYINAFNFYKIIYDDNLVRKLSGNCSMVKDDQQLIGRTLTPEVAGIIKSTHGLCKRWNMEPYEKDWTTEKEVRLKVGVQQLDNFKNGYDIHDGMIMSDCYFPKIAIPVKEIAFSEIKIKLSPEFKNRNDFLKKIEDIAPNSEIKIID